MDGVQMLRVGSPASGNMRAQMVVMPQGNWLAAMDGFIGTARASP